MASESQKQQRLRAAMSTATTWYAACEFGHAFWSGPDRSSYSAADEDAKAHDRSKHGGSPTAVALS